MVTWVYTLAGGVAGAGGSHLEKNNARAARASNTAIE